LTELDLSDTGIGDAGLAALSGLTKLRRLNLQTSNLTDAGMDILQKMPGLEELSSIGQGSNAGSQTSN